MNMQIKRKPVATTADAAAGRVAAIDWNDVADELSNQGAAVLDKLLTREECREIAALYPEDATFRSHIIMARHGFGKGEYKYFAYPLPDLIGDMRSALYPRLAPIANHWNERMNVAARLSGRACGFPRRVPRGRAKPPDTAAAAIRTRRLQLPASGPLRRAGVSVAGRDPAV